MDASEKDLLLDSIFEIFAQYGVRAISMDDIAQKLSLTKKALYFHFQNKEEIVVEALSKRIKDWEDFVTSVKKQKHDPVYKIVHIYFHRFNLLLDLNPWVVMESTRYYKKAAEIIDQMHQDFCDGIISPLLAEAEEQKWLRSNVDISIVCQIHSLLFKALLDEHSLFSKLDDRYSAFEHLFLDPIRGLLIPEKQYLAKLDQ